MVTDSWYLIEFEFTRQHNSVNADGISRQRVPILKIIWQVHLFWLAPLLVCTAIGYKISEGVRFTTSSIKALSSKLPFHSLIHYVTLSVTCIINRGYVIKASPPIGKGSAVGGYEFSTQSHDVI